jgi:hypothetical protein
MIGTIIGLIIAVVILGVFVWGGQRLMALIPLTEPFRTIVYVLFVILTVLLVVYVFLVLLSTAGIHVPLLGARL